MNELTYQELDIVRFYLQKEMPTPPLSHINLLCKIVMMMENYCEHDGEIGKDYPAEKCMKCGRMWE